MTFTLSNPCICVQATPKDKKAELLIRARVDEVCLAYSTIEQYFRHFIILSKDSLRCVSVYFLVNCETQDPPVFENHEMYFI
jgi:hypothetical protein